MPSSAPGAGVGGGVLAGRKSPLEEEEHVEKCLNLIQEEIKFTMKSLFWLSLSGKTPTLSGQQATAKKAFRLLRGLKLGGNWRSRSS